MTGTDGRPPTHAVRNVTMSPKEKRVDRPNIPNTDELAAHAREQLAREQRDTFRPCKICGEQSHRFDMLDFEKFVSHTPYTRPMSLVPVVYRRCVGCGFIFTSFFDSFTPAQWSNYVYNEGYNEVDGEFLQIRPAVDAQAVQSYFGDLRTTAIGLDFGGGNGRTAELLRRAGWAFDCFDPFGANELKAERVGAYNFCTAFEVLEHLPNPVVALGQVLAHATSGPLIFMISTALTDAQVTEATRLNWFYAGPRNGHISLFSRRSLQLLAAQHRLDYSNLGRGTHIMSRGKDVSSMTSRLRFGRIRMAVRRRLLRR